MRLSCPQHPQLTARTRSGCAAMPPRICVALALLTAVTADAPRSIEELVARYEYIFKTGNRNAASHLWSSCSTDTTHYIASYILDRARELEPEKLELLFRGFCPVSGSPLPDDPHTRFYSTLPSVSGGSMSGITHHCCWPCICDTQSAVKTDTKRIQTAEGPRLYTFLVIGDPCAKPGKLDEAFEDPFTGHQVTLRQQAPEVTCTDGKLSGAHFSDHGHVIIGMYFVGKESQALPFNDASDFREKCRERKEHGFDSGMGAIFQKVHRATMVAAINPIMVGAPSSFLRWSEEPGRAVELAENNPYPPGVPGRFGEPRDAMNKLTALGVLGVLGAALFLLSRQRPKQTSGSDSEMD